MKVWLDDERKAPDGWVWCRWPYDVIELLQQGEVTHLSLDHDLGEEGPKARTGYHVLLWIEREVVSGFRPPHISIHTNNTSARIKMELAVQSILRLWQSYEF